jgi:WW domain
MIIVIESNALRVYTMALKLPVHAESPSFPPTFMATPPPSTDSAEKQLANQSEPIDNANTTTSSAEPTPPAAASSSTIAATSSSGNWQAIWSPAHNAYYFYNTTTHETTWVNPLQPAGETASSSPSATATASTQEESSSSSGPSSGATPVPASVAQIYALQEAAAAQGIDPSLAHLDPSLAGPSAPGAAYNFTARFNAHTGAFTRPDGRDPTHLSEYERMKRMSSVYFDMGQWEQDVEQRKKREDEDAANEKKRKRPSKKDLVGLSLLFSPSVDYRTLTGLLAGPL